MLDDGVGQQLAHNQVDLGWSGVAFNLVTATRQRIGDTDAHFASNPQEFVGNRIGHASNERGLNDDSRTGRFVPRDHLQQWFGNN